MPSPSHLVMRLGFGFVVSQALHAVLELGIADLLADGPEAVEALAAASGADREALYRILRLLAAEGVFREMAPGRFALTEAGAALRRDRPGSPADFLLMINREPYRAFADLTQTLRGGEPAFDRVFGQPRFDWLAVHPEAAVLFQRAMVALGQGSNEAVAQAYDFGPFSRVVDVGGGHGRLLAAILARHPHLSGVLFDLPAGLRAAEAGLGGALPRTELVAGSFFEAVPAGADLYVLKKVIHDWDDERAVLILRRCREAMAERGRVLVAETLVPAGDEPAEIKLIDVLMLGVTGGLERTEAQYAALLAAAGLRLERVLPTAAAIAILEAVPV